MAPGGPSLGSLFICFVVPTRRPVWFRLGRNTSDSPATVLSDSLMTRSPSQRSSCLFSSSLVDRTSCSHQSPANSR